MVTLGTYLAINLQASGLRAASVNSVVGAIIAPFIIDCRPLF
jgi:hypothetical protein